MIACGLVQMTHSVEMNEKRIVVGEREAAAS